jgi:hypothetical protein
MGRLNASRGVRETPLAGQPFTDREIHQLAFGLPEQWTGIINKDRWRAHGAAVMDAWAERVEADGAFRASEAGDDVEEFPARPEPWPATFYCQPTR